MKIFTITLIFTFGYLSLFSQSILGDGGTIGIGVRGESSSNIGVRGLSTSSIGVHGSSSSYWGVNGTSTSSIGVRGSSSSSIGVYGQSSTSVGVYGLSVSSVGGSNSIGVVGKGATFDFNAQGPGINYGSTSSIRWKRNIVNIPSPLEKLSSLRGVYFDWDEAHGGKHDIGFIAEEVGQVIPEIVGYEENGVDASGMDYSKMTPLLVEAANAMRNECLEEIAAIKKENLEFKKENQELKTRLDKIESMLVSQDISQSQ